jgi:hypothetical protein
MMKIPMMKIQILPKMFLGSPDEDSDEDLSTYIRNTTTASVGEDPRIEDPIVMVVMFDHILLNQMM